jgi:L-lactate dehydrogenase complex protein LldG
MVEKPLMSERENILTRVREALTVPTPKPGEKHPGKTATTSADFQSLLPAVGTTYEEQLALFRANSADLKTDFYCVKDVAAVKTQIAGLRDSEKWRRTASHAGSLTDAVSGSLGLPVCRTDAAYSVAELEASDVGITECDALIAQTGSVLITNRSAGGRALSVLPPHHVVLAHRNQLLSGLPEAFQLIKEKYGSNYPSMISFITGPSRTGDIERILVLGAHGPKKLTIFLIE